MRKNAVLFLFIFVIAFDLLGQGKEPETIDVVLLGTFHYGTTTDASRTDFPDLFSEKRQRELEAMTDKIAKLNIDKIFIERPKARQTEYDSLYSLYIENQLNDTIVLRPEEIQIGFRMAKKLDHDQLFCVDVKKNLPYQSLQAFEEKYDEKEYPYLFTENAYPFTDKERKLNLKETTLPEYYVQLNDDYHRQQRLYDYLHYAMEYVDKDDYTGPNFSAVWYERNLKIYANILHQIQESDKTILILFGSSHTDIFHHFFDSHPRFNIVDLEKVLEE